MIRSILAALLVTASTAFAGWDVVGYTVTVSTNNDGVVTYPTNFFSGNNIITNIADTAAITNLQEALDEMTVFNFGNGTLTNVLELYVFTLIDRATGTARVELADDLTYIFGDVDIDGSVNSSATHTSGRFQASWSGAVASAQEITLGAGNSFQISGAEDVAYITNTGWTAGAVVHLQFSGSHTVYHQNGTPSGTESEIFLADGLDKSVTEDDILTLLYDGSQWWEISFVTH